MSRTVLLNATQNAAPLLYHQRVSLCRLENTPDSGVLPAVEFENGDAAHAEAFCERYFVGHRLCVGPDHVAEIEVRIVCVGEGGLRKRGRKPVHSARLRRRERTR